MKSKKLTLDLDKALEEIARKLRPSADAPNGCGQTNIFNTRFATDMGGQGLDSPACSCYCCSVPDEDK